MLLIALTHVRIKQRARVIIYYSIQSILEILSRTPRYTNLGSRLTNTYLRNIIIAKSFLPTLAHVYTSIYPITLSSLKVSCQCYFTNSLLIYLITLLSLNSCQPYFTDTLLIYPTTLSSLSFLHELYFTDSILIYLITLLSLKVSYTNSYTISNFLQLKVINNLSTKLSTCLPYLIYVFIYLFIYLFYYLFILFIIIILYYIISLTSKSYLRIFSIFDILYVYPKYIYYISI